jgi:hypothetical protein
VSLVGQWLDEAVDKTRKDGGSSLKLFKYHGPSRDKVRGPCARRWCLNWFAV